MREHIVNVFLNATVIANHGHGLGRKIWSMAFILAHDDKFILNPEGKTIASAFLNFNINFLVYAQSLTEAVYIGYARFG